MPTFCRQGANSDVAAHSIAASIFSAVIVGGIAIVYGASLAIAGALAAVVCIITLLMTLLICKKCLFKPPSLPPHPSTIPLGCQSPQQVFVDALMVLNDNRGTPGVNYPGSDLADRAYTQKRIRFVQREVQPHVHTLESYEKYREWIPKLTTNSLIYGGGAGIAISRAHVQEIQRENVIYENLIEVHEKEKKKLIERHGKQPSAVVVGAGPIGLSAALLFFRCGYEVKLYEQYGPPESEKEEKEKKSEFEEKRRFDERLQPFSLQPLAFHFLASIGLRKDKVLETFGVSPREGVDPKSDAAYPLVEKTLEVTEADRKRVPDSFGGVEGWAFIGLTRGLMAIAKTKRIGAHTREYVPNTVSLRMGDMQRLLYGVITKVQAASEIDEKGEIEEKAKKADIGVFFGRKCTGSRTEPDGRTTLLFEGLEESPDIIYNATGGKINEMLGFTQKHIVEMYGMGAFFDNPAAPATSAPSPVLSRAVRVFTSFRTTDKIYCNVELSKEEFENKEAQQKLLDVVADSLKLPKTSISFTVKIDLFHSEEVMRVNRLSPTQSQWIINGGDAAIKPHFITASGANFGLQGLSCLSFLLFKRSLGELQADEEFASKYSEFYSLLQKQSPQMVLNLFGRPLVPR